MGVLSGNRTAGLVSAPERYVAGADTRGRQEGRPYPWLQQVIHEISGFKEQTMQVTDKRIHQVKLELSLKECKHLRKAIDHYLTLYDLIDDPERIYPPLETDLDTLKAMSSHLKLVETSTVVEEIGL
jgi:hypothetical protein